MRYPNVTNFTDGYTDDTRLEDGRHHRCVGKGPSVETVSRQCRHTETETDTNTETGTRPD